MQHLVHSIIYHLGLNIFNSSQGMIKDRAEQKAMLSPIHPTVEYLLQHLLKDLVQYLMPHLQQDLVQDLMQHLIVHYLTPHLLQDLLQYLMQHLLLDLVHTISYALSSTGSHAASCLGSHATYYAVSCHAASEKTQCKNKNSDALRHVGEITAMIMLCSHIEMNVSILINFFYTQGFMSKVIPL